MLPRYDIQDPHKVDGKPLNSSLFQLPNTSAIPIVDPVSKITLSSSHPNAKAYQAPAKPQVGKTAKLPKPKTMIRLGRAT
jgi:hypothetical protein